MITHYGLFREEVPNSPLVKTKDFYESTGGLTEEWGQGWESIEDCKTVGDARRKFAKLKGVPLSHIYWGET